MSPAIIAAERRPRFRARHGWTEDDMAAAALVIVGILLVVIGLFVSGEMLIVGLGVVALIAGGILEVLARRI
jgi:membrane-bound ClpP family serine protease